MIRTVLTITPFKGDGSLAEPRTFRSDIDPVEKVQEYIKTLDKDDTIAGYTGEIRRVDTSELN